MKMKNADGSLNPGHRYRPGMASLAYEVLKDGLTHNVNLDVLQQSMWAEYLLYHTRMMREGKSFKVGKE